MGKLASLFQDRFGSGVRSRGGRYYLSGAVRLGGADGTALRATVRGSRLYQVELAWDEDTLKVSCECPYFADAGPCKHLWATILAADARDALPVPSGGWAPLGEVRELKHDDDLDEEPDPRRVAHRSARHGQRTPKPAAPPRWKATLASLAASASTGTADHRTAAWPGGELLYTISPTSSVEHDGLELAVMHRRKKKNGGWCLPKPQAVKASLISVVPDPNDRNILAVLLGGDTLGSYSYYYGYHYSSQRSSSFVLNTALAGTLLPVLCRTGRCYLLSQQPDWDLHPLVLDEGPPYEACLEVSRDEARKEYVLAGALRRGQDREALDGPALLIAGGWIFWPSRVARLTDFGAFHWIAKLRADKEIRVPFGEGEELLQQLLRFPVLPRLELPSELQFEEVQMAPRPYLRISKPERRFARDLQAELFFDYDETRVPADRPDRGFMIEGSRRYVLRDRAAEDAAAERLSGVGFGRPFVQHGVQRTKPGKVWGLATSRLPRVVRVLVAEGWNIEAEGALYRQPGRFDLTVSSGLDWFELRGGADFDGICVPLPRLLAALRRGENLVRLDDGSLGLLPEKWLEKYGLLAGTGKEDDDHIRFERNQAGLLDALLATQPEVTFDAGFAQVREELRSFEAVEPAAAPAGFQGTLRPYQRDGLGWLHFLRRFGFGGCLADDMGLGKTIQVLALFDARREQGARPSLVVVPRSLIFNWRQEAARFTPKLRVLEHAGSERSRKDTSHFGEHHLVLTTYGTLRRDITTLKDYRFDYVVLDESTAIKNPSTNVGKAVRLLQAEHRLCLSGTPIENHLGELWSQIDFLNPGMLGGARVFAASMSGNGSADSEARALLARALRPFILRRTKAQVAKDLPARSEQTVVCELDGKQRRLYVELRDHYRQALLGRISKEGMGRSKLQILEALLRLRQAACHPGLIDKDRRDEPSAKLDALLPQLDEVTGAGHKALVFSQFTSLLGIVRTRLEQEKIPYEYLDGRTRNREARVERFQNDPDCRLFLVSLKAGGLGLNLTAAEYVFLLDPWWNPAVEAQAIDRAHRIGQTRRVFAYRLIARDTVEEKVLELQAQKRELADAIISADNSLIRRLKREDLELLLG